MLTMNNKLNIKEKAMREARLYRYTFTTGTELVTVDAENLDNALLIIKAEYGCYLRVVKMDRI